MQLRTSRDATSNEQPVHYRRLANAVTNCLFDNRFFSALVQQIGSVTVIVQTPLRARNVHCSNTTKSHLTSCPSSKRWRSGEQTRLQVLLVENAALLQQCSMHSQSHHRLTLVFAPCMACFDTMHKRQSQDERATLVQTGTTEQPNNASIAIVDAANALQRFAQRSRGRLYDTWQRLKPHR